MNEVGNGETDEWIERAREGDADAFLLLVRKFGLPLRSFLASQLYHADEIDDLSQEVFITASTRLGTFERGRDFGAWLRGIARHKLLNHFRSNRRRSAAMERFISEVRPGVEEEMERQVSGEDSLSIEALLQCIEKLPEKLKLVVRAGLDGEKAESLAQKLEISKGAVYNLHYRANKLLRECVIVGTSTLKSQ